jgi:hypothetical protein
MAQQGLTRYERLKGQLSNVRAELKEGARIGTNSMLVSGGGIIAGYFQARHPVIPNTTFPTAAAVGSGLVIGGLSGVFDDYSDQLASLGSGMLAVVFASEAQKYFEE